MNCGLLNADHTLVLIIDMQERIVPAMRHSQQLVSRCEWLIKLAKAFSVPCLGFEQNPAGLGPLVEPLKQADGIQDILPKMKFSIMREPVIRNQLKSFKREQVVVAGIEAHVCVLQSVIDLLNESFKVFVVSDGIGSRRDSDLELARQRLQRAGAEMICAEMLLFEWLNGADHSQFRSLRQKFLEPV